MIDPAQKFKTTSLDCGIQRIVPHQHSIQVSHVASGHVVINYIESGRETVHFSLTKEQAAAFAALIVNGPTPIETEGGTPC